MKIVGLITEYNPFHNGHLYHLEKAKEISGADYVVAVMSGDFVQRGAPAIYHKYARADMALSSGADLVLELPSVYATSSAEDFAAGAVALLDRLGVVDGLCFGSECGDIRQLESVADILVREPEEYTIRLKDFLRQGLSYPDARQKALAYESSSGGQITHVLDSPNNILGVEYLKALKKRGSGMTPYTISRIGNGYHDTTLDNIYSSATAIRQELSKINFSVSLLSGQTSEVQQLQKDIKHLMPESVWNILTRQAPIFPNDLSAVLNYQLLTLIKHQAVLSDYIDVSPDLEDRIRNLSLESALFEDRISQLKTRQYTYTRISRALLHLLLDMKKEDLLEFRQEDYVSYARVLGFRRFSAPLLAAIKAHASLPLITKTADAGGYLTPTGIRMLEQDFHCSHIYNSIYQSKTGILLPNEYTQPLVIL